MEPCCWGTRNAVNRVQHSITAPAAFEGSSLCVWQHCCVLHIGEQYSRSERWCPDDCDRDGQIRTLLPDMYNVNTCSMLTGCKMLLKQSLMLSSALSSTKVSSQSKEKSLCVWQHCWLLHTGFWKLRHNLFWIFFNVLLLGSRGYSNDSGSYGTISTSAKTQ